VNRSRHYTFFEINVFWRRLGYRHRYATEVMSLLRSQLEAKLLDGMTMPPEQGLLFDWLESNGLFVDNDGGRIGFFFSRRQPESWLDGN
jgi:hypothetical protein